MIASKKPSHLQYPLVTFSLVMKNLGSNGESLPQEQWCEAIAAIETATRMFRVEFHFVGSTSSASKMAATSVVFDVRREHYLQVLEILSTVEEQFKIPSLMTFVCVPN